MPTPDQIAAAAEEIVNLMDQGKLAEVTDRLRADYWHMQPGDWNTLLGNIRDMDTPGKLDLLVNDEDGDGVLEATLRENGTFIVFEDIQDYPVVGNSKTMGPGTALEKGMTRALNDHPGPDASRYIEQAP